jgi:hypothetical protein
MSKEPMLDSQNVTKLERIIEEATRSTEEGIRRFVEPASGTLSRATSRQHHFIFGRRGSGKSSLLRKAAADLTVDRRPIAFVDLETFKGHEYPDVLLSVLIETFSRFAEWLETAAIAPASKTSFWSRLFGKKPSRPPFDKKRAKGLASELRSAVDQLRELLFSEDGTAIETTHSTKSVETRSDKLGASLTAGGIGEASASSNVASGVESADQRVERFARNKLNHLHRHIMDYQRLFKEMAALSDGDSYLFLDDLYHIRRRDQPQVIDYFHRLGKGQRLWLKIGTIRHRTQWYVHGDPPIGAKLGDDVDEIDLDLTLEKYSLTRGFLAKILENFLAEAEIKRDTIMTDGALDRLVLASGGVARDFLGILRRSIIRARERGETSRGEKIGVEDVNGGAGEYDSSKREELLRDTLDERQQLEREFAEISRFAKKYSKANVFLVDKDLPEAETQLIAELVDLRLIHKVRTRVTVTTDRPGKIFEAYMLDVSQYTASRKMREFEIVEFWRGDAADVLRRPGLIYKEFDGKNVLTKNVQD